MCSLAVDAAWFVCLSATRAFQFAIRIDSIRYANLFAWAAPAFCDWGGAVCGQRLGHRGAG